MEDKDAFILHQLLARSSAATALTYSSRNIPASSPGGHSNLTYLQYILYDPGFVLWSPMLPDIYRLPQSARKVQWYIVVCRSHERAKHRYHCIVCRSGVMPCVINTVWAVPLYRITREYVYTQATYDLILNNGLSGVFLKITIFNLIFVSRCTIANHKFTQLKHIQPIPHLSYNINPLNIINMQINKRPVGLYSPLTAGIMTDFVITIL